MEASLQSSDSGEAATACVIQSLSIHFEPEPATCTHMLSTVCMRIGGISRQIVTTDKYL